jgi:NAD(P)H-dependent FMN reductase
MKLLGICGSLQVKSSNLTLLNAVAALVPGDVAFNIYDGLATLPLFNPDIEVVGTPAAVSQLREELSHADGVIIASPEYGFSLPGSLKNAIDWVIGSGELNEKPIAVTASVGNLGRGQRGLKALLVTLGAVGARIVGGEPIVQGPNEHAELLALIGALLETIAAGT